MSQLLASRLVTGVDGRSRWHCFGDEIGLPINPRMAQLDIQEILTRRALVLESPDGHSVGLDENTEVFPFDDGLTLTPSAFSFGLGVRRSSVNPENRLCIAPALVTIDLRTGAWKQIIPL